VVGRVYRFTFTLVLAPAGDGASRLTVDMGAPGTGSCRAQAVLDDETARAVIRDIERSLRKMCVEVKAIAEAEGEAQG